jgi:hypothetical protein
MSDSTRSAREMSDSNHKRRRESHRVVRRHQASHLASTLLGFLDRRRAEFSQRLLDLAGSCIQVGLP